MPCLRHALARSSSRAAARSRMTTTTALHPGEARIQGHRRGRRRIIQVCGRARERSGHADLRNRQGGTPLPDQGGRRGDHHWQRRDRKPGPRPRMTMTVMSSSQDAPAFLPGVLRLLLAHPAVQSATARADGTDAYVLVDIELRVEMYQSWMAAGQSPNGVRSLEPLHSSSLPTIP